LKRKICLAFERIGITGVGWHTFRHTVGTVLAETGRASIHHPRLLASLESQCGQQVFAEGIDTKRNAQAKPVEAILPVHMLLGKARKLVHPNCTQILEVPFCK
jgi:hypothetical protein